MITFTVAPGWHGDRRPRWVFFNMTNASSLNYQNRLSSAIPLSYGSSVSGSITEQQRYVCTRSRRSRAT